MDILKYTEEHRIFRETVRKFQPQEYLEYFEDLNLSLPREIGKDIFQRSQEMGFMLNLHPFCC